MKQIKLQTRTINIIGCFNCPFYRLDFKGKTVCLLHRIFIDGFNPGEIPEWCELEEFKEENPKPAILPVKDSYMGIITDPKEAKKIEKEIKKDIKFHRKIRIG